MCYTLVMNKIKRKINTLIISDIHLGSNVSRADKVIDTLSKYRFKQLILLGDIFDDLDFKHLSDHHWNLISLFRKLSQKTKVVWVEGNHDRGLAQVMAAMVGIKVYKNYSWKYHDKLCLAIHGHQFDHFLIDNPIISYIASRLYIFIQGIDFKDYRISNFIKRKSKGWLRISKKVTNSAILYGRLHGADYIFCGHTHRSAHKKKKDIEYFNSGCWTQSPSTYITFSNGNIRIKKVR